MQWAGGKILYKSAYLACVWVQQPQTDRQTLTRIKVSKKASEIKITVIIKELYGYFHKPKQAHLIMQTGSLQEDSLYRGGSP